MVPCAVAAVTFVGKAESEIELIKDAAEEGLQLRDFPTAFRKIETAALKAMAANPQSDEPV